MVTRPEDLESRIPDEVTILDTGWRATIERDVLIKSRPHVQETILSREWLSGVSKRDCLNALLEGAQICQSSLQDATRKFSRSIQH